VGAPDPDDRCEIALIGTPTTRRSIGVQYGRLAANLGLRQAAEVRPLDVTLLPATDLRSPAADGGAHSPFAITNAPTNLCAVRRFGRHQER
jgi:hypothetical protein